MGQGGEHALLWARAWLHGHARGQCGAAVGRPVLTRDTDRREGHRGAVSAEISGVSSEWCEEHDQ